ncbi:hypothetical protein acdb102_23130 [Acidothermaceae bacterium B102]|nr:hypothetical protein acdb102_23130 [Acidothermaceae bacterium B102]
MRVVSDRLGHSTTAITADLYTHVLPSVTRGAAEAIADAVQAAGDEADEQNVGEILARARSTNENGAEGGDR